MMDLIKPIETRYNGHHFRSRLEARYAVLFDHMRIDWEYEPEGFSFGKYAYLPDFYLPSFNGGVYVEVKGDVERLDVRMLEAFSSSVGKPLVLCGSLKSRLYAMADLDTNGWIDVEFAEKYLSKEHRFFASGCCGFWHVFGEAEPLDVLNQSHEHDCGNNDLPLRSYEAAMSHRFGT